MSGTETTGISTTTIKMSKLNTCTSSTRPADPSAGDMLFETDTKRIITFDGSEWYVYEYTATTAPIYTLTVNQSTGGTISVSPSGLRGGGDTVTLSSTADANYEFTSWNVQDSSGSSVVVVDNTFTMPYSDVTISAVFTAVEYDITVASDIEHGSLLVSPLKAAQLAVVTITPQASNNYELNTLTVSGVSGNVSTTDVGDGTYTFTMPAENVSVTATFTEIQYNITVIETAEGSLSVSSATAANHDTVTITPSANDNFTLDATTLLVSGDSGNVSTTDEGDGTYTFTMPAEDVTVSGTFIPLHTITIDPTITGGTVTSDLVTTTAGETVTLTVAANDTFTFNTITVTNDSDNSQVTTTEVNAGSEYTFTMPGANVTVTATFTQ
jgi:azurin